MKHYDGEMIVMVLDRLKYIITQDFICLVDSISVPQYHRYLSTLLSHLHYS